MRLRPWPCAAPLALLALACRQDPGPAWIDLARGAPAFLTAEDFELPVDGGGTRIFAQDGALFLQSTIRREEWASGPVPGLWSAPLWIRGLGRLPGGNPKDRLTAGGRVFAKGAPIRAAQTRVPGTFNHTSKKIWLYLETDEKPPRESSFAVAATPGFLDEEGFFRIKGRRFSGRGLPLWRGESRTVVLDVPPGSVLRTVTCAERAVLSGEGEPVARFRVELNGAPLLDHAQEVPVGGSYAVHELRLPAGSGRRASLVFSVEGDFAYTSFLAPVLGPAEVGRYGERPWSGERPSIVVFLADTFRADNLGVGLTPEVDAFAAGGLSFPRTWSVSTYTLPAHTSMFAGIFPRQGSIDGVARAMPEELETVAELLRDAGYRTAAITDSGLMSQGFGMDQGFDLFDEAGLGMESTLERVRAFLDADDGRPVFLWVQTYETHREYRVSAETVREHGSRLGLDGSEAHLETEKRLLRLLKGGAARGDPEVDGVLAELRALYLGTVADLDRGFGRFLADLRERGLDRASFVMFTSDHGEAFHEHGELYHKGKVYEEQVRVPLAIQGPGVAPAVVGHAASLIDVAPTIAAMVGLERPAHWLGTSLLSLESGRPIFAGQCDGGGQESTYALIDGTRKVISFEDEGALRGGRMLAAFDLAADPGEVENLAGTSEWAPGLLESLASQASFFLEPVVGGDEVVLDGEALEELRAMGYAGN